MGKRQAAVAVDFPSDRLRLSEIHGWRKIFAEAERDQMTNAEQAIAAKLGMLEFVLEVVVSNQLAALDPATSDNFKAQMVDRQGYLRHGSLMLADELQALEASTQAELAKFFEKVADREAEIRGHISR